MKIQIKTFGKLADMNIAQGFILEDNSSIGDFREYFVKKYPGLKEHKFLVAINNKIVDKDFTIQENDELVLMPPYSGG